MNKYKQWNLLQPDEEKVRTLGQTLGAPPLLATIMVNRGIGEEAEARCFLQEQWNGDYPHLPGLSQAATLLEAAREQGEQVTVYGDYDADGICSTVIMFECLQELGYRVSYHLPSRFVEGYGLSREAVTDIAARGAGVLLTVDCGISARDEVLLARELGLKVIVTDHHQPPASLPDADVIINPKLDTQGVGQELAGAGVAFCLALELLARHGLPGRARNWLDVLALATVADIVPLTGFNRIWVREGLELMAKHRPGLQKLLETARVKDKKLDAYHIGYILAPRLNAAGRLEGPLPALELLLTTDQTRAQELATYLDQLNTQRQSLEEHIYREALQMIENGEAGSRVMVLGSENWHQGVIGIVASRLAQKYCLPTVLVSWDGDTGKGSARGTAGFDILEALRQAAGTLDHFGGHRGAAGIELQREQFAPFCQQVNQAAAGCYYEPEAASTLNIDLELTPEELSLELGYQTSRLKPFGEGNPAPVLKTTVEFERVIRMGKNGEHFKGWLKGRKQVEVVSFREGALTEEIAGGQLYDLAFTPEINEYNGVTSLSLKLVDIRPVAKAAQPEKPEARGGYYAPPTMAGSQLVVCPDRRCLDKFIPYYRECYGERAVILAGRAPRLNQGGIMLQRGEARIFLTTPVYFPYHIKKFGRISASRIWLVTGEDSFHPAFLSLLREEHLPLATLKGAEGKPPADRAGDRQVMYINRSRSMMSVAEAGIDEASPREYSAKRRLRERWVSDAGLLITGGDILGLYPVAVARLTMADPPLSRGEARLLQEQFPAPVIEWTFPDSGLTYNQCYLNAKYPEAETIKAVLTFLASRPGRQHHFGRQRLVTSLCEATGSPLGWQQVAAALIVLGETGVISTVAEGEQLHIAFTSSGGEIRLADSLYYMEGKWEKREWRDWQQRLPGLAGRSGETDGIR